MERLALKVAYDGTKFHGSQRQPNVPTVEDALLSALARIGACQSADEGRFQMASRTDAGVSAAGNVAAVTTAFHPDKLADALNASLRFAWVLGAARVPADFHPRRAARRRRYRYFLPASGLDDRKLARALLAFVGEHDWTSFSRPDEDDEGPRRGRLDAVEIADRGAMVALDVTAPSFRWNQVRRMVEAARRVAAGEASLESVEAALAGKEAVDLGLAPAENLVLLDVDVGVAFALPEPASARVLEDLGRRLFALAVEREVLGAVHEAVLERE